jgi:hypothetical protein
MLLPEVPSFSGICSPVPFMVFVYVRDWMFSQPSFGEGRYRLFHNFLSLLRGGGQVVSRRLPTAAAQVRAQVRSRGICGGQSGTGAGFLRVLLFPLPILIPPTAPHSSPIVRGWYNRPVSGRRTKWTQSHPIQELTELQEIIWRCQGQWRYNSTCLVLCKRWRWVVSFTPLPLYPRGKEPPVHIEQEAGWAPEPVWTLWRREQSCIAWNRTPVVQPVARCYADWAIPTAWFLERL